MVNRLVSKLNVDRLAWPIAFSLLAPLALYAYIGSFSRYMADDYCTAWTLGELGFLESQDFWYTTWSGRFSFTAFVNLLQAFGPGIARVMPGVTLCLWVGSNAWFAHELMGVLRQPLRRNVLIGIGALMAVAIVEGVPNAFQSIYWLTGITTYSLPLIGMIAYAAWVLRRVRTRSEPNESWRALVISFMAAFILGGFSETTVSLQTAALSLLLLASLVVARTPHSRHLAALSGAGLIGSLLAMWVILLSPGTGIRQGLIGAQTDWLGLIQRSLVDLRIFASVAYRKHWPPLALTALLPFIFVTLASVSGTQSAPAPGERTWAAVLVLPPVLTVIMMLGSIVPYEYALATYPDSRVLITTQAVLVAGLMVWGVLVGWAVRRSIERVTLPYSQGLPVLLVVALVATAAVAIYTGGDAMAGFDDMQGFAESWDERDLQLREAVRAGVQEIQVASLNHMGGLDEITFNPDMWVNRCLAQLHGLGAVVAK